MKKTHYRNAARLGVLAFASALPLESEAVTVITDISQVKSDSIYCDVDGGEFSEGGAFIDGATVLADYSAYIALNPSDSFDSFVSNQYDSNGGFECGSTVTSPTARALQQTARAMTQGIQRVVTQRKLQAFSGGPSGGSAGDAKAEGEWNTYATPTFSSIEQNTGVAKIGQDTYQLSFGADTRVEDFIYGAAGSYTKSDSETGKTSFYDYRVAPYISYSFNKNLYATAITGYSRADFARTKPTRDGNGAFTDASLGYILPVDKTILVGRMGHRFTYFGHDDKNQIDSWENTYYLSGEALYKWGDFLPYINATWEHLDPEDAPEDVDSAFLKLGLQYALKQDMTLGLSYQTELTGRVEDSEVYYSQAQADFRIRF